MKNKCALAFLLAMVLSASSSYAVEKEITGKLGTAYAFDPSRFGLDVNFNLNWVLDPYFVLGPEVGFYWINWNRKIGTEITAGVKTDVKRDTDAYMFPVMIDAQLRLPNLRKYLYVSPYAVFGMGYSFMELHYSQPNFTDAETGIAYSRDSITKFFSGFTWQLLFGAALKPGSESNVEFIAEIGYRGAKLTSGNVELDMSGMLIRVAVRYPATN